MNREKMRTLNELKIARVLRSHKRLPLIQLVELTDLSRPTVLKYIKDLNLVTDKDHERTKVGRPELIIHWDESYVSRLNWYAGRVE